MVLSSVMGASKLGVWLAALVGAGALGCAADTASSSTPCVAGRQIACACETGGQGVQTCSSDSKSYGPCTGCSGGGWAGSGASGGGGGASGGASGGGGAAGASGSGGQSGGEPFSMTDSLKDSQPKGNPVGGSLGASGWTVTGKTDRVWYALPRLVEGSIEFTVSGITTSNLDLADHEIFSMYDAGYGISEPINYNPEFRDNHYKQLIRIYGQQVPERLGEQKFIMLMCPDGAPGYGQCACSKSFYDGDGWWGGNPSWDGSPSKLKVTWGNGKATYSRDGVDVWTNDYASTGLVFGPSELHFTLGCSRHDAVDNAGMPIGATFSDVVVQGITGPVATCN
jgi:hypothetical protein